MAKQPLLKKENFKNIEYAVVFFNLTTQTQIRSADKVKIAELGETWMSLKVPKTSCNKDHHLLVHVLPKGDVAKLDRNSLKKGLPGAISITASVKELSTINHDSNLITLHFMQYNDKEWQDFLKTWAAIQQNVDQLMNRIKY